MRVLITGAAGFIGSHLAQKLAKCGHDVVGVDCFSPYYSRELKELNASALLANDVPVLRLDLSSDPLEEMLDGVNVVFHAAAQPGISNTTSFDDYLCNNIVATRRLAEACIQAPDFRGFVNVATSSVYGLYATEDENAPPKPTSYYGVTKLAAEQLVLAYCREGRLPACSVRLFSVYGPRERPEKLYPRLIHSILTDTEFPLYEGSLQHSRSFTYVDDILAGFLAVLDRLGDCRGEIFNLGSDIEITTAEGIAIVEGILGTRARTKIVPKRAGDQRRTHANITKARKLLGYTPETPPEDGLRREVAWYKDEIFGKVNPYQNT